MKADAVWAGLRRAVGAAALLGTLSGCNPGGILGCQPVAPVQLPSGAAPGTGVGGVAGGFKQFVWGDGLDRVELWVGGGMGEGDLSLYEVAVRGHQGTVYRAREPGQRAIGLAWSEGDCDYTVFLDASRSAQELAEYAAGY